MKMGRRCQACGAGKDLVLFPNMSMFRFPKDPARCQQWIENAGLTHLLNKVPLDSFQNMRLCPQHFTEDQFVNHFRNSLNWFAVPTIFNNEEIKRPKVRGAPAPEPEPNIPVTRSRAQKTLLESSQALPQATSQPVEPVIQSSVPSSTVTSNVLTTEEISTMLMGRTRKRSRLELSDAVRLLKMFKTSKVYCKSGKPEEDLINPVLPDTTPPCRVCGERNWDMVSIFDTEGFRIQLLDKIHLHLPIRVEPNDSASLKLCRSCVDRLQGFHQMYERCAELIVASKDNATPQPVPAMPQSPIVTRNTEHKADEETIDDPDPVYHTNPPIFYQSAGQGPSQSKTPTVVTFYHALPEDRVVQVPVFYHTTQEEDGEPSTLML